jgi:nicotinate-nucleotide pyrophosphorylase (carboxylating)
MTDFFNDLTHNVQQALHEDLGDGDLTAQLIDAETQAYARVICRENAVICGRPWFDEVFKQLDDHISIHWYATEGQKVQPDTLLCELKGSARHILSGERTALNFLQTLSGTATVTAEYVAELQGFNTQLLDTRKTLPGLRLAQKYAVKCGGATNHRIGLYDAILIKENHIIACGDIQQAVKKAKVSDVTVEVETESLEEVEMALDAGADIIMLDNFALADIQKAVEMVAKRAKLEVSGNVEIAGLKTLAATGVDYISTGAITKHLKAIDLSMRFEFLT